MYFENIVIGKPLIEPEKLLSKDSDDWETFEKEKTYFTDERFLPKILVELGIYPSVNEIRRNKPGLVKVLNDPDFIDGIKVSKKRKLWIIVGN
jgi:hypothetical protein